MHLTFFLAFLGISMPVAMCSAGLTVLVIGLAFTKSDISEASGLDKIVAMSNLCFAVPLAVFGAEHLSNPQALLGGVPSYMPWRMFWVYFVGYALMAGSLSIATKIGDRWSGLLFGLMMFSFVAMIHFPGALAERHNRILWTIVFRESSFGGGGLILASAANGWRLPTKSALITFGRVLIAIAAVMFGLEHFLHPLGLPGVPLEKLIPTWIPARVLIDYVTGSALVIAGVCLILNKKTRAAATWLGSWIWLLVLVIYVPVMVLALRDPNTGVKVEGINYFADTLLFGAEFLVLANAIRRSTAKPALSSAATAPS